MLLRRWPNSISVPSSSGKSLQRQVIGPLIDSIIISVPSSSGKSLQPLGSAFIFSVIQAATKRVFRKLHFCKKSGEVCEICVVGLPKTAVVCYVHGCRVKHFKIHRHSNFETRTLRTEHGRELDLGG